MEGELYIVNVEAFVYHEGKYLMVVRGLSEEIAPGTLTPPGGKVEASGSVQDVLEQTLRREVREEAGVDLQDDVAYVESHLFEGGGQRIVDLVFLARYLRGEPSALDEEEVGGHAWLSFDQILSDPRAMPWTRESLRRVEAVRKARAW